jgi:pyruvoyl-dependent arginine decarboxylase (PvlArgDC)
VSVLLINAGTIVDVVSVLPINAGTVVDVVSVLLMLGRLLSVTMATAEPSVCPES